MVSCLHLPYVSSCFHIMLQSYPRFLILCKEQNSSRVRVQAECACIKETTSVHLMYSGLHQCRQTFLTKLQLMRWKTPLMVISYQIYMEHVFLKLSTFGFGYNSHWIFPHINTFAYLNKGERCMTFSDVRCYKTGPFLFTEL